MGRLLIEVLTIFAFIILGVSSKEKRYCFPKEFGFGVATAAYQIEGAWNVSDKGESIWDHYTHRYPGRVFDHTNGDEAADSYHRFDDDLALLEHLGVRFYRFSISWPRVLPTGFSNKISHSGIRYYNSLIDKLLEKIIAPVVTIYHWDLPQSLQDLGGWTNPVTATYYVDYARVLFEQFGDRVQFWISFNEPRTFCGDGYGGFDAPGGNFSGVEDYMCGHTVLRAHGMVYAMYQQEFLSKQKGYVGITLDTPWFEPGTTSPEDQVAAEIARQFNFGWFAHPIFSRRGDYPLIMRNHVDQMSKKQGLSRSRLPTFTDEEIKNIRGAFDFLGLNHYTTQMVKAGEAKYPSPSLQEDEGVLMYQKADWPKTSSSWLRVVPWGFRKVLNWIKTTYDNPAVLITENGFSTVSGVNDRQTRLKHLEAYLRNLHGAVVEDGCNVRGYTHWSLMDNFEWMRGYSERFGLYEVDFSSPNKTRTARASAEYFAMVAQSGCLPSTLDSNLLDEDY